VTNPADRTVTRIDPATGETRTFALPVTTGAPQGLAVTGNHLWVVANGDTLVRLRAADGHVLASYAVGPQAKEVYADGLRVWVGNQGGHSLSVVCQPE
jgi:streptogramin lyase